MKYIILLFIVGVMWTIGSKMFDSSSPWDAFAQITDIKTAFSDYFIGLVLLVLIAVGAMFVERFFCRYLCPLGALFNVISFLRILKINKPTENCGSCRLCTNNCSMGIDLYKSDKVSSGECINCFKCTDICPKGNAQASICNQNVNSALVSSVAIGALVGVYAVSNVFDTPANLDVLDSSVVSSTATPNPILNTPISLPKNNSVEIEPIITPQTESSQANNNVAVSKIQPSNDVVGSKSQPNNDVANNKSQPSSAPVQPTQAPLATEKSKLGDSTPVATPAPTIVVYKKYTDGTYEGVGRGYRPGLKVSVTIKNDKITSVQVIANNETPSYAEMPFSVIPKAIVNSQSVNVNGVSGATRTSDGIKAAVSDALTKARI